MIDDLLCCVLSPIQYGLYSSFMGSFVYAVFGTAKDVAVGPSAIVSILTAQYATGRSPITRDPTYAIILALFTGIIQCAMGLLQLGQYTHILNGHRRISFNHIIDSGLHP